MKKIKFLFTLLVVLYSCDDNVESDVNMPIKLFTLISDHIVGLNALTGEADSSQTIMGFSSSDKHSALTFDSENRVFYLIQNTVNNPILVKIDESGSYTEIGSITYNGSQIDIAEALAYDDESGKLYMTASLNGGVDTGDYWSESLMTVSTTTAEAAFLTEIITSNPSQPESDTDDMDVIDGILYLVDAGPPGANFMKLYDLDINDIMSNGETYPTEIFATTYYIGGRIAVSEDILYVTSGKSLYKLDLEDPMDLVLVGQTHTSSEFDGEDIVGVVFIEE